ncbi:MAG TPA: BatA domain-containing protein [Verrucomicrobiae bacterium]
MSFLAPLFLAGAAAIALPFLFHLIRRSSREKVIFSSLMFLDPSPPRITKRSRLEHLLLLLLRCAVICLLAFAFARPFLQKPMAATNVADESARVAILVDTSASMRREDLWEQAKQRAIDAVRRLGESDAFAVYTFDQQLRTVLGFADAAQLSRSDRVGAVQTRLAGVTPSWSGTHLGNALIQSTEHLLEQLNRDAKEQGNAVLRMVVISDLQSGAKLDGLQGFEWPSKLQVQLEPLTAKEKSNAGIQVLEEVRNAFVASTNSPVRVRVQNSPGARTEQFELQWRRGGVEPFGEKQTLYVPAGQSRIVTAPAKPESATTIALMGDSVEFDNLAYSAQPKAQEVLIAYYGPEHPDDPQQMRYYLHRAFDLTNLTTRVLAFTNSIPTNSANISLLVLGAPPTPDVTALARNLLREGRTVLFPLRDEASANLVSELTGKLASAPEAQVNNFGMFGRISFQHPLFAPFSDARFSDFTKIHFWKHRALDLSNITNANVIASFDTGQPLLAEIPMERGRLLVLGSTWRPADSQLALSTKFVPLLFGMLEQSANLRQFTHRYSVGDAVSLPSEAKEIKFPNGEAKAVSGTRFTETTLPGVYSIGDYQFAVNLDPAESRINSIPNDDLSSLGVPLGSIRDATTQKAAEARQRNLLATDTEARQKMWRNFLLAALIFIVVESWLSGRLSRGAPAAA